MKLFASSFLLVCCFLSMTERHLTAQTTQPNIIFICFDDLNHDIEGMYGLPQVETPNLKALEQLGTLFFNSYTSAPQCGPSRTSFLTGKDLAYTQVYNDNGYENKFRKNFTTAKNNEEVFTLPEYLKDSAGYFTFGMNKLFHSPSKFLEYDNHTADACNKGLSWSKWYTYDDEDVIDAYAIAHVDEPEVTTWYPLPDAMEPQMEDYIMVDTAAAFIRRLSEDPDVTCSKPLFMALGFKKPHQAWFIPEKYFSDYYFDPSEYYTTPFDLPYNTPHNAYPYNGLVMPPQPDPIWADYDALPSLAKSFTGDFESTLNTYLATLSPLPDIDLSMTEDQRTFAILESRRADAIISYMAAIKFVDAQVGRFMDSLSQYPEIYNNSIIVVVSDHGYALGEKKHWSKIALWDPDVHIPIMVVDLRNTEQQVCYEPVSLLDIFPTLCDFAEVDPPTFSDGSPYLDGKSLMPQLNNPGVKIDRTVISAIERNGECECYPQYSVRNSRFHYIRYQSNNGGSGSTCDPVTSYFQEELYDIGVNRETDPNEWKNLALDPNYADVKEYLQKFLPGQELYLKNANQVDISDLGVSCFASNTDLIKLRPKLYDLNGNTIGGAALTGYKFIWTNSLTNDSIIVRNYNFNMAAVPPAVFAVNDKILFYLHVYQIATGKLVAFNTSTYYINAANLPTASYHTSLAGSVVSILDYSTTGSYTSTSWRFDNAYTTSDFVPAPYDFVTPGTHKIKNFIYYGNACSRVYTRNIPVPAKLAADFAIDFQVYPNPASDVLNITIPAEMKQCTISIINTSGQVLHSIEVDTQTPVISMPVFNLAQGVYIVEMKSEYAIAQKTVEIIK